MSELRIYPGFADPVQECQAAFRALLSAMSQPGTRVDMPLPSSAPEPLSRATAAMALTLLDHDCDVWLDACLRTPAVEQYLHYHTAARQSVDPEEARFVLIGDPLAMPPLNRLAQGSRGHPDVSASVLIQLPALQGGQGVTLIGPGIEFSATIDPVGLPDRFWTDWADNGRQYPQGVDVLLTDGERIVALPRTTKVTA